MEFMSNDWLTAKESTGTTIMAVEFDGGVVIGADSRTSSGTYVSNRVTDKLTRISDKIYCCRSGSAADTQAIADIVSYSLNFHENQTGEEPLVAEAAAEIQNYCFNYRDQLLAGIIVAGWDKQKGGQVYQVPLGGMCIRRGYAIGGSGSSYVHGFIREFYREGMSRNETVEFVKKAIWHAMYFDGSSGGVCRVGVITKDGIDRDVFFAPIDPLPTQSAVPATSAVRS
ncbi:proteasome subunit beta type-6 isoform X2 [Sitodiplosis mosellana]|uniref:proteasome subunit beta type-6 isoform X1 n=1 Tax=Sitodiplosis mosellana TaxID=263140 RepID=UPI002443C073|nr:proteasome subunit beta type-6 isoform X1 [Sitodiplosis mosellana]XP_055318188.1 proteasome subunit beta type-6 isoform X2 [Sitodiplosis mosellana]